MASSPLSAAREGIPRGRPVEVSAGRGVGGASVVRDIRDALRACQRQWEEFEWPSAPPLTFGVSVDVSMCELLSPEDTIRAELAKRLREWDVQMGNLGGNADERLMDTVEADLLQDVPRLSVLEEETSSALLALESDLKDKDNKKPYLANYVTSYVWYPFVLDEKCRQCEVTRNLHVCVF